MVSKPVPGPSAARLERAVGPLAPRAAAELVAGAAHAVGSAHRAGLVHGRITLGSLFPDHGGVVHIVAPGPEPVGAVPRRTPGTAVSALPFAPPEQLRGRPITPAADVYALGAALYHLLTGRLPWPAGPAGLVAGRLRQAPRPASSVREGIPDELDAILSRALAVAPADRYRDGEALAAALEGWLALLTGVPRTGLTGEAAAAAFAGAFHRHGATNPSSQVAGEAEGLAGTLAPPPTLITVAPAILAGAMLWAATIAVLALVGLGVLVPGRPSGSVLGATATPQELPGSSGTDAPTAP